jgi:alkanesulfonate monooxygenase SsuD/methylene tetrahydromethanopterin reductase-like flavin-dependent oxidoreductase (luciferase family)
VLAAVGAPVLWARGRVAVGRARLAAGAARAAPPRATHVAAAVPVALGPDAESARRLAAWWLSTYLTRMGPIYPRLLERFSGPRTVAALRGEGQDLPSAAEQLARDVTLFGTYDEAPEQIAAWRAAGADSVQLVLPPGRPEDELAEIVEVAAAAERVARL